MLKNNYNRRGPTKQQLDGIILPSYSYLSKKCVSYINELGCPPQYIADTLRDSAEAITNSYPEFKRNSSDLRFF